MSPLDTLDTRPASVVADTLARDRLGTPSVMFFQISSAAPLTVIGGVITTALAVTGVIALPLAFGIVAVSLALFIPGYLAMSRNITNTGAFYAYVSRGLGRPAGVASAFVALVAYNALQVGLYGAWGTVSSGLVDTWFGAHVAWYWLAGAAWLVVGVLGLLRVDVAGKVLAVLLCAEVAIVVILDVGIAPHPYHGVAQLGSLNPANMHGNWGAALAMAVLAFVGIEQGAVLQEETRQPRLTVRRATYATMAVLFVLYAATAFLMSWAAGDGNVVARAGKESTSLLFNLAAPHVGSVLVDVANVLFCTSLGAALISFNASCARYGFSLGREGVLFRRFGRASVRQGSPAWASLAQSVVGLAAIVVWSIAGWDPLVTLFFYGGTYGGFGVLLLFTLTSLGVLAYFWRHPHGETLWTRRIAPLLGFLALLTITVLATANYGTLLGVRAGSALRWVLPASYLVIAAVGACWALLLKRWRPTVHRGIGLGVHADSGMAEPEVPA